MFFFKGIKAGRRISSLAIAATVAALCYVKQDELGELYKGSLLDDAVNSIMKTTKSFTKRFTDPNSDKLLPDWPPYPHFPPDTPCPPTLVLDLEQ